MHEFEKCLQGTMLPSLCIKKNIKFIIYGNLSFCELYSSGISNGKNGDRAILGDAFWCYL